jgi:hypothetical protein
LLEGAPKWALPEKVLCLGSNAEALLVVLWCNFSHFCLCVLFFCILIFFGSDHLLGWQMTSKSLVYTGFVDGASRHTLNLKSAAWVIYEPSSQLLSFGITCLGPSTNNIAEYSAIIELLLDAISHGIQPLVVHLDSQLAMLQLNGQYRVHDPSLL